MSDREDFNRTGPNPWISSSGEIAHPDSPRGGGGPGFFASTGPLRAEGGWSAVLPDPGVTTWAGGFAGATEGGRGAVLPLPWVSTGAGSLVGTTAGGPPVLPSPRSPSGRRLIASDIKGSETGALPPKEAPAPAKTLTVSGVVVAGGPLNDATIDLVNEAAKTQSNKRYIGYDSLVRVGGSIAWRANNPGNLRDASTKIGTVPGGVGNFAVFATIADGRAAQRSLYLNTYGNMTVRDAVTKLTPPSENDTAGYLKKLAKAGVDLDKDVKTQIDKLMSAIQANEGLIEGTEVTRAK